MTSGQRAQHNDKYYGKPSHGVTERTGERRGALLLARRSPLEARNHWGGTVLGCTLHFARENPEDAAHYAAIVERLLAAGADPRAVRLPTGIATVDAVFRRHGAIA